MKQLNDEQMGRLRAYAEAKGHEWKYELNIEWMRGHDAELPDGHLLRQIRNQFGPLWLSQFTPPKDWNVK